MSHFKEPNVSEEHDRQLKMIKINCDAHLGHTVYLTNGGYGRLINSAIVNGHVMLQLEDDVCPMWYVEEVKECSCTRIRKDEE